MRVERGRGTLVLLLVAACFASAILPGLGSAADPGTEQGLTITDVTYANESLAQDDGKKIYVWRSGGHSLSASIGPTDDFPSDATQCVRVTGSENASVSGTTANATTTTTLGCKPWPPKGTLGDYSTSPIATEFDLGSWTENRTGSWSLTYTVSTHGNSTSVLANRELTAVVVERTGDLDGDGLDNTWEAANGTDLSSPDSDTDGLDDGPEVRVYGTSPLDNDTDGDGLRDAREVNGKTEPDDPDSDNDSLDDYAEVEGFSTDPTSKDSDGDSLQDGEEVHEYGTDPDDPDSDEDGLRDGLEVRIGTDPRAADTDGDFLGDSTERELGTDPTSALSTLVPLLLVVGVLVLSLAHVLRSFAVREMLAQYLNGGDGAEPDGNVHTNGGSPGGATQRSHSGNGDRDILLTDEDKVLRILQENDGRVGQSLFTDETDWSKSKVSRLLSKMEDNEQVRKINVGRENIIALPGQEPENSKSPYET